MKTDSRILYRSGSRRTPDAPVQCVVVTGNGDTEQVICLLAQVLKACGRTRTRVIVPGEGDVPEDILAGLQQERCTHALLRVNEKQLVRPEWAALRPGLCVLTGAPGAEESVALARRSRNVVYSPDEPGWSQVWETPHPGAVTYAQQDMRAQLTARNLRLFPSHVEFEAVTTGRIQRIFLPVAGGFSFYHGLCVLACGLCLGLDWEDMGRTLRSVRGPAGHMEVLPIPAACSVVLDRAQTAPALERLLTCTREFTAGRLICLLTCSGGADGQALTRLGNVAGQLADRVILTGDGSGSNEMMAAIETVRFGMTGEPERFPDRGRAIDWALDGAGAGDVIVLAGSRLGERAGVFARERAYIMEYFTGAEAKKKGCCRR